MCSTLSDLLWNEEIKYFCLNKEAGGYLIQQDGQWQSNEPGKWRGFIIFLLLLFSYFRHPFSKKTPHTTTVIEALSMFKYTTHELLPRYKKVSKI